VDKFFRGVWRAAGKTTSRQSVEKPGIMARRQETCLSDSSLRGPVELTLRGLALGGIITAVFTAANLYLGLKVGVTFASSIPAAVISMAVLRALGGTTVLENNMVQTQASAAGTLSSIIFVLPGLLIIGFWHGFPFWQSAGICIAGGTLGVLFTIPLRRAMVVGSDLPYPEGVAAAEILRVGGGDLTAGAPGVADIAAGSLISGAVSFATTGLHVLTDGASYWFSAGAAIFQAATGFSLALVGTGYLIGLWAGLAMVLGAALAWGIAVPVLSIMHPAPAGTGIADWGTALWGQKVRFIGAGVIGVAAIRALVNLARPTLEGVRVALRGAGLAAGAVPRAERDLPPAAMGALLVASLLLMAAVLAAFTASAPPLAAYGVATLTLVGVIFATVFGFLIAAVCGYMAGLVGASVSPISGIGILATLAASLLAVAMFAGLMQGDSATRQAAIAFVLAIVSFIIAIATISNDNLQDLKTGLLVGATPWKQQVALVVGCVAGGVVIPPILNLLYTAYGFPGALPRVSMDPHQALAAPQATLMAKLATGILGGTLEWSYIGIGAAASAALILVDLALKRGRTGAHLPVLAVGLGIYLPPAINVVTGIGAVLGWLIDRGLRGRADEAAAKQRGVLIASGFIVGESLVGVALAGVIAATGRPAPLALAGDGFAPVAQWFGVAVFGAVAVWFWRRVRGR
jgi:putative OPT family oligopeptide transporter